MASQATAAPVPSDHIMGVYSRAPLAFERGRGAWLYTADGEAYLDCVGGIAVTGLGHAHPKVVQALKDQADKLWHVSNIFRIPGQEDLARKLCEATFADMVFFTNSGTEAVECALKAARKYHWKNGQEDRIEVLGFDGGHESGWMVINGVVATSSAEEIIDPAFYAVLVERAGGRHAADLPFELCLQDNGDLLPRSLFGDGPNAHNGDNQ